MKRKNKISDGNKKITAVHNFDTAKTTGVAARSKKTAVRSNSGSAVSKKTSARSNSGAAHSNSGAAHSNSGAAHSKKTAAHANSGAAIHDMNAALENITAAIDAMAPESRHRESGAGSRESAATFDLKPQPREQLDTPNMPTVTPTGNTTIRVEWNTVGNASGYTIKYATNNTFTENVQTVVVTGFVTVRTVTGLAPGTTYYFRVGANGSGNYGDSAFSGWRSATTTNAPLTDDAGQIQSWLDNLQDISTHFFSVLPQFESTVLNTADRRRLNGSGVRRYGFIDKTADVADEFPQFWPNFVADGDKLKEQLREIEVLRNMLVWTRYLARIVQDQLLLTGNDALRTAGLYYASVRESASRKIPEAVQVYEMLRLFWQRRRKMSEEPTEQEMERDFKRLMHGKADGTVAAHHAELSGRSTEPHTTGGVREVIDDVRSTKHRAQSAKCKVQSAE